MICACKDSAGKYVSVSSLARELGASPYQIRAAASENRGKGIIYQPSSGANAKWLIDREEFLKRWNGRQRRGIRCAE